MIVSNQEIHFCHIRVLFLIRQVIDRPDILLEQITLADAFEQIIPIIDDRITGSIITFGKVGKGLMLPTGHDFIACEEVQ